MEGKWPKLRSTRLPKKNLKKKKNDSRYSLFLSLSACSRTCPHDARGKDRAASEIVSLTEPLNSQRFLCRTDPDIIQQTSNTNTQTYVGKVVRLI